MLENITHVIKGCMLKEPNHQKMLYEHYRAYAFKVVFRYIYRYEKAVDVVNDGFIKLFNHFPRFEAGDEADNEKILMGWLRKIMINAAIDELRRSNMLPEIGGIPESGWDATNKNDDADRTVLYNDLITLIKELRPAYRVVFNLYVIDGYSHGEIADILGVPVGTSKSNLARARVLLQASVKKMEEAKLCRI